MNIQVPVYQQESCNEVCRQQSGYNINVDEIRLQHRATREFVPADKKDVKYWFKRVRNNASARKSRMKRKAKDKYMEREFLALQKENVQLRNKLAALNFMCVRRSLDKYISGAVQEDEVKYKPINGVDNYEMRMCNSLKEKTYNDRRYDQIMMYSGATDSARDANDSMREDVNSYSSDKSEMGDSRTDCFSPTIEENYCSLTSGSSFRTQTVPYMVMKQSGECGKVPEDRQKRMNDKKIQQIPHKIRIKERIHSAFAKENSII